MSTRRPDPRHFPSYRKASTKQGPGFRTAAQRTASAQAFRRGASTYHDVRPGYPDEVTALIAPAHTVADIGAGTGKLTESLPNERVIALEPSADMAGVLASRLH
ncbi:MAG: class I SAM-dependent methyltransferase, partial [Corynebacterium sp.]